MHFIPGEENYSRKKAERLMMAKESILVVEDEEDVQELIKYNLAKENYQVDCVGSGEQALVKARGYMPDLILLDLMLPGIGGLEVCRRLKGDPATAPIPIIIVSARGEESDIVSGLELGADDYITKPFSPRIMLARLRVVLRRRKCDEVGESDAIKKHNLVIDPVRVQSYGRRFAFAANGYGIQDLAFSGHETRLGFHPRSNHKRDKGRQLPRNRTLRGCSNSRSA